MKTKLLKKIRKNYNIFEDHYCIIQDGVRIPKMCYLINKISIFGYHNLIKRNCYEDIYGIHPKRYTSKVDAVIDIFQYMGLGNRYRYRKNIFRRNGI